jgi:hypothetical protein
VNLARFAALRTPPVPLIVPPRVFDGFGWCESDELRWGRPRDAVDRATPIDGSDPARMVFVFHAECTFLPRELARLHAFGLGLDDEMALAPYAIDDATDELFARRTSGVRPRDLMWLAADNVNALFWGLHDWAHFHNHGPFEERAYNELQCDAAAMTWLWINRDAIGINEGEWRALRDRVAALVAKRFEDERVADPPALPIAPLCV